MASSSNEIAFSHYGAVNNRLHGKIISVLAQLTLLLVSVVLIASGTGHSDWNSFLFWCRYGTFVSLATFVFYAFAVGGVLRPMSIVIISFVAFQFGIPILYGFVPGYSNWYAGYLNVASLTEGACYTVVCIQAFVLGASLLHSRKSELKGYGSFCRRPFLTDSAAVEQVSTVGFILTGLIAVPRSLLFFLTSSSSGIAAARSAYETDSLENLARGFFIPFGLLLLVYLPKGAKRNAVFGTLCVYSLLAALAGDRTEGLTLMVALAFWLFGGGSQGRMTAGKKVGLVVAGVAIVWLLAFIADVRMGGTAEGLGLGAALVSALEEMGFNSLTIGFQMQLSGEPTWGLSYLASLGTLIPASLDFAGINDLAAAVNPVNQYYAAMGNTYSWASFGLGYSLIAESYVNFGWFGWIAIAVIGAALERLLHWDISSPFGKYLSLVFLWSFLTLPRRQLTWLANAFEYDLLFVLVILWTWYSLVKARGWRAGRSSSMRKKGVL